MLDEKQQNKKLSGISASDGVVILQVIARLVGTSNIRDMELAAVGGVRDKLVASVEKATGVNFDQVRAAQQAALRRAQEEAAATAKNKPAQVTAVETAVETGNGKAAADNKESTG